MVERSLTGTVTGITVRSIDHDGGVTGPCAFFQASMPPAM